MNQLPKYTWLIETIRRAGKISHKDLSDKWQCACRIPEHAKEIIEKEAGERIFTDLLPAEMEALT